MTSIEPVPAAPAALALVEDMWRSGALTKTQLRLPEGLSFETYEAIGAWLGTVKRSSSWWLADWLAYGEDTYRHRAEQAIAATGLAEQSLMNLASIGRRVPPSVRREDVPIHLHAEVKKFPPREQAVWLDRVQKHDWSQKELRHQINGTDPNPLPATVVDVVSVEDACRELVRAAKSYGADYLVPRHAFQRLVAALGEGTE